MKLAIVISSIGLIAIQAYPRDGQANTQSARYPMDGKQDVQLQDEMEVVDG